MKQGWRLAKPTIRKSGNLTSAGHIIFHSLTLEPAIFPKW